MLHEFKAVTNQLLSVNTISEEYRHIKAVTYNHKLP